MGMAIMPVGERKMNTIRVGELTVQERNAVVPDGAKVWIVGHPDRGIMHSTGSKQAAITWAKEYQEEEILMARNIIEIGNAPCVACGSRLEVEVHSAYSTQVECAMCRYRRGELTPPQAANLRIVAAECGERVPSEE
jgi:hypothetical protein